MNILTKIARVFSGEKATVGVYTLKDEALGRWFSGTSFAGRSVTEGSAMQIAAVWACVRILSEAIGSLSWSWYSRERSGNTTKISDHPLSGLLESPNLDMTSVEFREALVTNLALGGNAYALREVNGAGDVSSLYPLRYSNVVPKRDKDGTIFYEVNERGKWERFPREKVWHIKGFGSDGLIGFSPIQYAKQAMGLALATEEFQARFFSNGAAPSMMFSVPQWLKDDQRTKAKEALKELWSGLANSHVPQLLEGGMKPEPVTMPLEDAQFLQLRGFSVQEICRIYRIPPHMVADLSRSTNNNIEQQSLEFVMYCLAPYLARIEASAKKWLLQPEERLRFFLKFNVESLLRADAAGRAALHSAAVQNGWLNRNEVRELENKNQVPGLDVFTAQTNLAPVDMLASVAARSAPNQTQPPPTKEVAVSTPVIFEKGAVTGEMRLSEDAATEIAAGVASGLMPSVTEIRKSVIAALTPELRRTAEKIDAVSQRLDRNIDSIIETSKRQERIAARVAEAVERQSGPRKAVFDKDGNPVGSIPCTESELITH